MLLQIALDMESGEKALEVMDQIHDIVDIVEAGQVSNVEGSRFVSILKERYHLPVVWDQKVTGLYTCIPAIGFGADYVSIISAATDARLIPAIEYAHAHNCKVIGDFCTETCNAERMLQMESMGCDQISFHPNYDQSKPVADTITLEIAKHVLKKAEISVYGGFTLQNVIPVLELQPDIVVVGAAIWAADNPRKEALAFKELIRKYEK